MAFEWDDEKNQQNIAKHGVRFEDAIKNLQRVHGRFSR
jgi:uncharacterized DUF497 family protein